MLQWMDDFSCYGLGSAGRDRMLDGNYAEAGTNTPASIVADPDPYGSGAPVLQVGTNNVEASTVVRKVLTADQATVGVAARYWFSRLPSNTGERPRLVSFRDVSNNILCYVTIDPSGYLEAYNSADTLLARSSGQAVLANGWAHYETRCTFSAAAGTIEVRYEGGQVLYATGVATSTSGALCHNVGLSSLGQFTSSPYIKDLIIWDASGAVNNDFFGPCEVYKIVPDGDVSLGWTPSSGATGWDLINEDTPDEDAEYISAGVPLPALSRFTMTDLPIDVTVVKGVMSMHRSRKTDSGDGSVQITAHEGGSSDAGSDRSLTTAYSYWSDMFDLAPDGGNWSKAKVDALEMAINRTT